MARFLSGALSKLKRRAFEVTALTIKCVRTQQAYATHTLTIHIGKPQWHALSSVCLFCDPNRSVILQYLEDKYGDQLYTPATAEDKQLMNLQMRLHDLYIASPNCTAPG